MSKNLDIVWSNKFKKDRKPALTLPTAKSRRFTTLAARVQHFKETEKGATKMCREIEKLLNEKFAEGWAEGWAKGWAKGQAEVIFNLMKNANTDFDTAAKMAGWSDDASTLKPLVDAMKEADNQEAQDALKNY